MSRGGSVGIERDASVARDDRARDDLVDLLRRRRGGTPREPRTRQPRQISPKDTRVDVRIIFLLPGPLLRSFSSRARCILTHTAGVGFRPSSVAENAEGGLTRLSLSPRGFLVCRRVLAQRFSRWVRTRATWMGLVTGCFDREGGVENQNNR